jgi:hypothetical protein
MMRRLSMFISLTAAGLMLLAGQGYLTAAGEETLVIRAGTLIDGRGGEPMKDAVIII